MKIRILLLLLSLLQLSAATDSTSGLKFSDGDTIVYLGDSITHGGVYHSFINLFYLTRFPDVNIHMVNAGVAGNQTFHAIDRFEDDVMIHNPTIIVLMLGMNDAGVYNVDHRSESEKQSLLLQRIHTYRANMDSLSRMILNRGIRLVYIAPSIYDDTAELDTEIRYGGNEALGLCRDVVCELAKIYNAPVVDFFTIMNEVNAKFQKENPSFTVVGQDRVHPGVEGHLLMAYEFLSTQGAPRYVSKLVIDAEQLKVETAENCVAQSLMPGDNGLLFTSKSNGLPFPVLDNAACDWVPLVENLNQETLIITGLADGTYTLNIDNISIGTFSSREMADGINLALYKNTPRYQQALRVKELNDLRSTLVKDRIRTFALFDYTWLADFDDKNDIDALEPFFLTELEKIKLQPYYGYIKTQTENYLLYKPLLPETRQKLREIDEALHLINQPVTHKFQIAPVK